ncbi:3956_t:CDS:1, partial [Acaulospora colombiana]
TLGATPYKGLKNKLPWMFRCLGCPFLGLFYFCNVGTRNYKVKSEDIEIEMSAIKLKQFHEEP